MVLRYEPIGYFGCSAMLLGLTGAGNLVYHLIDNYSPVRTNTIVVLRFAFAPAALVIIADLMVQLNKRRHYLMPCLP